MDRASFQMYWWVIQPWMTSIGIVLSGSTSETHKTSTCYEHTDSYTVGISNLRHLEYATSVALVSVTYFAATKNKLMWKGNVSASSHVFTKPRAWGDRFFGASLDTTCHSVWRHPVMCGCISLLICRFCLFRGRMWRSWNSWIWSKAWGNILCQQHGVLQLWLGVWPCGVTGS